MNKQMEKALFIDLVEKKGEEEALTIFKKLTEIKDSGNAEVYEKAVNELKESISNPAYGSKTRIVGDNMVGEGKTEKLDRVMRGSSEGFTENIKKTKGMSVGKSSDALEKVAKHRAARQIQKEAAEKMFGAIPTSSLRKGIGKAAGKIPVLGALAGPLATLALTGNPNEALASGFDTEDLGEGSDEIEDQGLSRADLGKAERRTIGAMDERESDDNLKSKKRKFSVLDR